MQCPQCRQANDDHDRFCLQCGARLRPIGCASCGGALPAGAHFCPQCGTAASARSVASPGAAAPRDAAETLLAARDTDPDTLDDPLPSPEEVELVERVRAERASSRRRVRGIGMAAAALVVLLVALVVAQRAPRERTTAPVPSRDVADAESSRDVVADPPAESEAMRPVPPVPRDGEAPVPGVRGDGEPSVALPPRTERAGAPAPARTPGVATRPPAPAPVASRAPAALPAAVTPQTTPDVRAEVKQIRHQVDGTVDYSVKLSRASGEPVRDADVRLRGVMADGLLVETRLDPGDAPGVYRALIAFTARGPRSLTLRIARADGVTEVPVADVPSATPAGR